MTVASIHAASSSCLSASSLSSSSKFRTRPQFSNSPSCSSSMAPSLVRIAVVGDVHGYWHLEEDTKALQLLQPDLVLFTGDFGEEDVELVQSVADLQFAKAVILGNHDAWHTQEFGKKRKDGVQRQLEALGDEHVGYRRLDFPELKLSVVGGRPFSCGGDRIFRKRLLVQRYGVQGMDASAERIYKAALGAPEDHLVIILAHNGPTGLGSELNDICGRDWLPGAGDHGDPDLEIAIQRLKQTAKHRSPLIVFGHMHRELAFGNGLRKMVVVEPDSTVYLNGAIVPRVQFAEQGSSSRDKETPAVATPGLAYNTSRAFTLVEVADGKVGRISESWVTVAGERTEVSEELILFKNGA